MSLYIAPNEDVVPTPGQPRITQVRAYVSRSDEYGASDVHDTSDSHWIQGLPDADGSWDHESTHPPITNPMSRYPKYSGSRSSWGVARVPTVIVEIEDDEGRIGIGTSTGGEAAAFDSFNHEIAVTCSGLGSATIQIPILAPIEETYVRSLPK